MQSAIVRIGMLAAVCAGVGGGAFAQPGDRPDSGELIPGGPRVGVDDRFFLGQGLDAPPSFLETMRDGGREYLYAAGPFVTADGAQVNGLARWDGERWEGLGDGSVFTIDGRRASSIEAMAYFDDGRGRKLYVGGVFDRVGDVAARGVACWDGERWSPVGDGFGRGDAPGFASSLVVFDDGVRGARLFAGGWFDQSGETALAHLAMLEDGRWVPVPAANPLAIAPDAGNGSDYPIRDMAVFLQDGAPMLAVALAAPLEEWPAAADYGVTFAYDGARWRRLWSVVTDPDSPHRPPFSDAPIVNTLEVDADGTLYAAGSFSTVEQITELSTRIAHSAAARWDGERWRAFVRASPGSGVRIRLGGGEGGSPGYVHYQGGPGTLFSEIVRPQNDFGQAWWSGRVTGLHIDDGIGQLPARTQHGRRSMYEFAIFDGMVHAGVGFHPHTYEGSGNGVVCLDEDGWRTVTGSRKFGLGANQLVSALHFAPSPAERSVLATGFFSSIGGSAPSFVAAFNGRSWSAIGDARFLQENLFPRLAAFHAIDTPQGPSALVQGGAFRRPGAASGFSALNIVQSGGLEPLHFMGVPIRLLWAESGAVGSAEARLFAMPRTGNAFTDTNAVWDGVGWQSLGLEEFDVGAVGARAFGVDGEGAEARLVLADQYLSWDGSSWRRMAPTDFFWVRNSVRGTATVRLDDRPSMLAIGDTVVNDTPPIATARTLARLQGDDWLAVDLSQAPIEPAWMGSINAVTLRGRQWALLNQTVSLVNAPFSMRPGFPALFDGERVVSLSEILGVEFDGRVYDILSNPLPDGREEVILAGDFATIGGVPSSRIGRVVLPDPADVNGDLQIDGADLGLILGAWGTDRTTFDLNFDGVVDGADVAVLADRWQR